jgi:hypothetical protein
MCLISLKWSNCRSQFFPCYSRDCHNVESISRGFNGISLFTLLPRQPLYLLLGRTQYHQNLAVFLGITSISLTIGHQAMKCSDILTIPSFLSDDYRELMFLAAPPFRDNCSISPMLLLALVRWSTLTDLPRTVCFGKMAIIKLQFARYRITHRRVYYSAQAS